MLLQRWSIRDFQCFNISSAWPPSWMDAAHHYKWLIMLLVHSPTIAHLLVVAKLTNFFLIPVCISSIFNTFSNMPHVILVYNVWVFCSQAFGNLFVMICYHCTDLYLVVLQKVKSSHQSFMRLLDFTLLLYKSSLTYWCGYVIYLY